MQTCHSCFLTNRVSLTISASVSLLQRLSSARSSLRGYSQPIKKHSYFSTLPSSQSKRKHKSSSSPVSQRSIDPHKHNRSTSTSSATFRLTPSYLPSLCSTPSVLMSSAAARALTADLLNAALPAQPSYPTLLHYGNAVLRTSETTEKARLTVEAYKFYHNGSLPVGIDHSKIPLPPDTPARPKNLTILPPAQMPRAQKGIEFKEANKIRLIHSLAHIESYAIDLSWDILVRFALKSGNDICYRNIEEEKPFELLIAGSSAIQMPTEFFADWLRIAYEEAQHFTIWSKRLQQLNTFYGALPAHNGLWTSALETNHSLLARLCIVHAVHEAHGLDQSTKMLAQFHSNQDKYSAELLENIEMDEITHVKGGMTWFKYIIQQYNEQLTGTHTKKEVTDEKETTPSTQIIEEIPLFHRIVRKYFHGALKGPFNHEARAQALMTKEYYEPLTVKDKKPEEKKPDEKKVEEKKEEEQKVEDKKEASTTQAAN